MRVDMLQPVVQHCLLIHMWARDPEGHAGGVIAGLVGRKWGVRVLPGCVRQSHYEWLRKGGGNELIHENMSLLMH